MFETWTPRKLVVILEVVAMQLKPAFFKDAIAKLAKTSQLLDHFSPPEISKQSRDIATFEKPGKQRCLQSRNADNHFRFPLLLGCVV